VIAVTGVPPYGPIGHSWPIGPARKGGKKLRSSVNRWNEEMTLPAPGRTQIKSALLLICDATGKVQAVTSKASCDIFTETSFLQKDVVEIMGLGSSINSWLEERISEARNKDEYSAETSVDNGTGRFFVKLDALKRDDELYGFALQVLPVMQNAAAGALRDGDSVVERKQWHEIKNHVGALKLYATFLKRKMPEGDERQIVEKIFNAVNDLIGYLDRIRRGDAQ
jgi:nitrogen-specific signal transduction histidine kinase